MSDAATTLFWPWFDTLSKIGNWPKVNLKDVWPQEYVKEYLTDSDVWSKNLIPWAWLAKNLIKAKGIYDSWTKGDWKYRVEDKKWWTLAKLNLNQVIWTWLWFTPSSIWEEYTKSNEVYNATADIKNQDIKDYNSFKINIKNIQQSDETPEQKAIKIKELRTAKPELFKKLFDDHNADKWKPETFTSEEAIWWKSLDIQVQYFADKFANVSSKEERLELNAEVMNLLRKGILPNRFMNAFKIKLQTTNN